jgi:GTP diphosphokinase / guanosine-3',5'-bis(diphosphate) 3'-diphosphatase
MTPTARLLDALAFAALKHRDQRRKDVDASPYINHPIALARVLSVEAGIDDEDVLIAAILHDTVEDTDTTLDELRTRFGNRIASLVAEVTDDTSLDRADRKRLQIEHAPSLTREAALIKLADKICNLRDVADNPPPDWPLARRREYFEWACQVIDGLRGAHPQLEKAFDEANARCPSEATS